MTDPHPDITDRLRALGQHLSDTGADLVHYETAFQALGEIEYLRREMEASRANKVWAELRAQTFGRDTNIPPVNRRHHRAMALTSHLMNIITPHLDLRRSDYDPYRKVHDALMKLCMEEGAEFITDADRMAAGLPPREPNGWTREELALLEAYRLQVMYARVAPVVMPSEKVASG
jgi:hypothetical protein